MCPPVDAALQLIRCVVSSHCTLLLLPYDYCVGARKWLFSHCEKVGLHFKWLKFSYTNIADWVLYSTISYPYDL